MEAMFSWADFHAASKISPPHEDEYMYDSSGTIANWQVRTFCRTAEPHTLSYPCRLDENNTCCPAVLPAYLGKGHIFFCLEVKFCSMSIGPTNSLHRPTICFNVDHIPNLQTAYNRPKSGSSNGLMILHSAGIYIYRPAKHLSKLP